MLKMLTAILPVLSSFILTGKGPVTVFSSGLYGTMPSNAYSLFLKDLSKDYSVVTAKSFRPVLKKDVEEYCLKMKIDEFIFVSHSSFDHTILESKLCKKAFLLDPVSLPEFPFENRRVQTNTSTNIIKCKFSYKNKKTNPFILPGFSTSIKGSDVQLFEFEAGHIDILDNFWADLGRTFRIYSMYDNNKNLKRSNFRKSVVNIIKKNSQ